MTLDVVARSEEMGSIETRRHWNIPESRKNLAKLFQPRADCSSHSRGVLDENPQAPEWSSLRGLPGRFDHICNSLLRGSLSAGAGMHHDKISAQGNAAHEFIMERLDGTGAQHGLRGGQIDQIIGMNNQRAKSKLRAARAKGRRVHLWNPCRATLPHARAGRKDLQGIASQLAGGFEGVE